MRVAVAHLQQARQRVHGAGSVAGDQAGGNAGRAQQHGHRTGELLTIAAPLRKQEVIHGIAGAALRTDGQVVAVLRPQVAVHHAYRVVGGGGVPGELPRQHGDAGRQARRQLQVALQDEARIGRPRPLQLLRRGIEWPRDHSVDHPAVEGEGQAHVGVAVHVDVVSRQVNLLGTGDGKGDVGLILLDVEGLHQAPGAATVGVNVIAAVYQLDRRHRGGMQPDAVVVDAPAGAGVDIEDQTPPVAPLRRADAHHDPVVEPAAHAQVDVGTEPKVPVGVEDLRPVAALRVGGVDDAALQPLPDGDGGRERQGGDKEPREARREQEDQPGNRQQRAEQRGGDRHRLPPLQGEPRKRRGFAPARALARRIL